MKRIFAIGILLGLLTACEPEPQIFTGPYHVRFTESALTKKESFSEVIKISVHLVAPAREEEISINYDISGSARENIDYQILGTRGVVNIDAGNYFGFIEVRLINNANNILRSQDVIFTLRSVTGANLRVGQSEGGIGRTFTLTIQDDCILGGSYLAGRGTPNQPVTITSQNCEQYILSNWNIALFTSTTPMDLSFIDNGDNTLTIPEQEEENISEEFATIRGTGVVDPITGQIILTITLVDFEDQPQITLNLARN
ncbi:MAG: hypothetical protein ACOYXA_18895 [Bacteroidota bacterium]